MAASVIQEAVSGASLTAGSATTITASITVSAGSRIKATAIGDTGTAATATFTDNSGQGVAWTSHGGPLNISNFRMFDGSSKQFAAATFTVTCTFASAMSTRGLLLQEIAGADNNAVQDAKSQTQNPVSAGTDVITTPSMTATGAGLVVGVTRNNGGANLTAGTGFTGGTSRWTGSGDPTLGVSKHVSAGATAATWSTTSAGGAWWSSAVIFGDAGAGATASVPDATSPQPRPAPARQPDSAQGLPAALKSPWVFVEPPRIVPPRRQEAQSACPLPPLAVAAAVSFAPANQVERRPAPAARAQSADPLPPARISPWFQENAAPPRPTARRAPPQSADPLPPVTIAWVPLHDVPLIARARRIVDSNGVPVRLVALAVWAPQQQDIPRKRPNAVPYVAIPLPAALPAPVFVTLQGPFYAVVDHVELTLEASGAILAAVVDGAELTEHVDGAATSIAVDSVTTTVDR